MGQAISFDELRDMVRRDFSDDLLVSHGLFRSPYPRGTHVMCEVDLRKISPATDLKETSSELVLQVIRGFNFSESCVQEVDQNVSQQNGDQTTSTSTEFCSLADEPTNPIQEFQGESVTDVSMEHSRTLTAATSTSRIPSSTEHIVELIKILAPQVPIQDVSYDAIVSMLCQSDFGTGGHKASSDLKDVMSGIENSSHKEATISLSSCAKENKVHANIVPMLGALKGTGVLYLFYPPRPFTLESLLYFSPKALDDDWNKRFLAYQLLSGIAFCHAHGVAHGDLKPSNVLLTDNLWCWITGFHVSCSEPMGSVSTRMNYSIFENRMAEVLKMDFTDWQTAFRLWWKGEFSNYDYLLFLNMLAGRKWGDRRFHTVMPWVIDFSTKPDETSDAGWRDLTKSKWRLAKGDEQLDFTYATAEIPHHVSDECLSELAVCIYKARRLPLFVLQQSVRSVYEPNEYPVSLQRLYHWTPDECIPEFYSDASVFSSTHPGMSDLAVPSWARDFDDFIKWHRAALEGDHVSRHLHEWIDLTFGCKLSGEDAVLAKNVTLSSSSPSLPRSQGRRQLFFLPHPQRQRSTLQSKYPNKEERGPCNMDTQARTSKKMVGAQTGVPSDFTMKPGAKGLNLDFLSLEQASVFCESARHLSPVYRSLYGHAVGSVQLKERDDSLEHQYFTSSSWSSKGLDLSELDEKTVAGLVESFQLQTGDGLYQDFLLWQTVELQNNSLSLGAGDDIFALGCVLAEIYLLKPLFDPISLRDFELHGVEPGLLQLLPAHVQTLVRLMLNGKSGRTISASSLLESPFFPPSVRAVHSFLSILYLLEDTRQRLKLVAKVASKGVFSLMGTQAANKCISVCLSPFVLPYDNIPVDEFSALFTGSLAALKPHDVKVLLLPVIQKVLQGQGNPSLKAFILRTSFITHVLKSVGLTAYLQYMHRTVLSTLQQPTEDGPAQAASCLLIETCQEIGVPITISQTVIPLLQQFGRDITAYGINTIVGIGRELGEFVVVKHLLPSLRTMITSCLHFVSLEKAGPAKSWRMLVIADALLLLERLLDVLSSTSVLMELVQGPHNILVALLLHSSTTNTLRQQAAKVILSSCKCIGPDATAVHVLPQLQHVFDLVVLSSPSDPKAKLGWGGAGGEVTEHDESFQTNLELARILYCGFTSNMGIDRLRQGLPTWPILEQLLFKMYSWKCEAGPGIHQRTSDESFLSVHSSPMTTIDFSPTSLLLHEIGWSVPQPSLNKSKPSNGNEASKQAKISAELVVHDNSEPWMWLNSSWDSWEGTEYLNRPGFGLGTGKDERPWKLKASTFHYWRAHPGSVKAVAVGDGESTILTAGAGMRMRGLVKLWKLSTTECVMEYGGHEEVVNDICLLPWSGRAASCDGTIHLWDVQSGERLAVFSESTKTASLPLSTMQVESKATNMGTALSSGMLPTGLHGCHYTSMHLLEAHEQVIAGTGNGNLRFIDLSSGRLLHIWQCDLEFSGSSLVSAIASSGEQCGSNGASPAWLAMGFSLGHCRLLDIRSGSFMASWRAHEGFITKLAAFGEHYLLSSSLDKTLILWDLRRTVPAQLQVFRGHKHGVSSFSIWSNNLLSAGGNRIGVSMLSQIVPQSQERHTVKCHKLYSPELSNLNLASITTISVLPFSRLFVVGTDDGYLRMCK